MPTRMILACLALLLTSSLLAQGNPSSETQQPAASAQSQPETKATTDSQKEPDRDHKMHLRLGTVSLGAGYFSSPFFFSPFWPYGFYPYNAAYAPFFYGPFYSPFYGPYPGGLGYAPDKGEVKLSANPKQAEVFLDGAYAGTVDHLKSMWLDSGAYNLSISAPGRETFQKRIYVLSGKSLRIEAKLSPEKNPKSPTEEKP